jgi:hypothetical protein
VYRVKPPLRSTNNKKKDFKQALWLKQACLRRNPHTYCKKFKCPAHLRELDIISISFIKYTSLSITT